MASIEVYTFEDAAGVEQAFTTQNADEARQYARANRLKWIANTFEWADSELVEDNTPKPAEDDDDDREPIAEGDARYYRQPGAVDR